MGMKRVGLIIGLAVGSAALVGCSSSSGGSASSSTTTVPPAVSTTVASTTTAGGSSTSAVATSTTAAPAGTTTTTSTTAAGRDGFVGSWHVHGGQMTVPATGNVTITYADGAKAEVLHLSAALSPDADRLHLVVVDFGFVDATTSSTVPSDGNPQDEFTVGDSMDLTKVRTGELQFVDVHTHNQPLAGGNSYWCGTGLDPAHTNDCGA